MSNVNEMAERAAQNVIARVKSGETNLEQYLQECVNTILWFTTSGAKYDVGFAVEAIGVVMTKVARHFEGDLARALDESEDDWDAVQDDVHFYLSIRYNTNGSGHVAEWEMVGHGFEHEQYFQGCGVAFTDYNYVVTGIGDDDESALEDVLEQLAQMNVWASSETVANLRTELIDRR